MVKPSGIIGYVHRGAMGARWERCHGPHKKLVMTRPIRVPGYGKLRYREIRKEELIDIWDDILTRTGLEVTTGETVTQVKRKADGLFTVDTTRRAHPARRVILAIGRRVCRANWGCPARSCPCGVEIETKFGEP